MISTEIHDHKPENSSDCISFESVDFHYENNEAILQGLSFNLKQGSMNFVVGPSGSGKTSLLKLMYLNQRPSSGHIKVFGKDAVTLNQYELPSLKRKMGIVLQDFSLIKHLNVFENVALPLRVAKIPRADYLKDVISLLQWVGLGDQMQAMPATLSGGQAQRAAIARAIISKPDIIIADEPTGNVDHKIGKRLIRLFCELNRLGTTVIIATHDLNLIPEESNVLELENGKLLLRGSN